MADRAGAERLLRHPVAATLTDVRTAVMVAASVAGDPPSTRLAWIDWRGATIVARLVCPPARPNAMRPVVATEVRLDQAGIDDRVIVMRAAPGIERLQVEIADQHQPEATGVGPEGVALARLDLRTTVLGIDALSAAGEAVGRLDAAGIGSLALASGRITGRLGTSHGLAAGFGAGYWIDELAEAAFEAGFSPRLPAWVPDELPRGKFHIEPDVAYPVALPSVAVAWGAEPQRVLVRQTPGTLTGAVQGGARSEPVQIGQWTGELMARGRFAALVWEADDRAFGVQVVGFDDPGEVAVRVGASL
jgi:hypothetical protein